MDSIDRVSTSEPEDDASIFVIDDELDERHELTCGDDLPSITEFQDVIDYDSPIQYTRDQLLFHVLNTITYNASLTHRNKWLRLANQYVDLFLRPSHLNIHRRVLPVIYGKHTLVVSEDDLEELRHDQDAPFSYTTMKALLNQKKSSGTVSIKEHVQRMYKVERTFSPLTTEDATGVVVLKLAVQTTTPALLYQSLLASGGYAKKEHPNCTVFQATTLYEGDNVDVSGFAFLQSDEPLMFDTSAYRLGLQSITSGDGVLVMTSSSDDPIQTQVISHAEGVLVTGSGHSVYTNDIWKNTAFVYKSNVSNELPLYSKRVCIKKGVIFTLLPDDPTGSLTTQAMLPTPTDLIEMFGDSLSSVLDASRLLSNYGMSLAALDVDGFKVLQSTLSKNVAVHLESVGKKDTSVSRADATPMAKQVRNLTRYGYAPYEAHGAAYDTVYNRMKYYMGQGDDGMIYMLSSVSGSMKRLDKAISQSLPNINETLGEDEDDLHHSCSSRIKKTYTSIDAMFDDETADQFREGDIVQVASGSSTHYFKRFRKHDGSLVWAKDYTHIVSACSDVVPLTYSELLKTECVFDDYEKVCSTMTALQRDNLRSNMAKKRKMIEDANDFIADKVRTAKALKLEMHSSRIGGNRAEQATELPGMTADETRSDYADFVGTMAVDFENQYGFTDFAQGSVTTADTATSQPQHEPTGDAYIDALVGATGLSLPLTARQLMAKQLASAFPQQDMSAKLEQLRAAVHKKIGLLIREKMTKAKTQRDREQLIAQANKLEEQTFQKKRKELLDSQGASDESKIVHACALFVIAATIYAEQINFDFVIPKCKSILLKSGMVEYIYCVFQYLAEAKASQFQFLPATTAKQAIQTQVKSALESNVQLALAYSRKSKQLDVALKSPESTVWPSFRPLMGKDGKIRCADARHDVHKHIPLPAVTKYNKNVVRTSDLSFMSKPVNVGAKLVVEESRDLRDSAIIVQDALPAVLKELATSSQQTAEFWNELSEIAMSKFDTIFSQVEVDGAVMNTFIKSYLKASVDKIDFASTILRRFITSKLVSIIGRISNNWRVEDTDKTPQEELELIDITLDANDIPNVKHYFIRAIDLVHTSAILERQKGIYGKVHQLYYWLLVLAEVMYCVCMPIRSGTSTSGFGEIVRTPLKHYTVIAHLISYILKNALNALELNTFVVKDLQHAQESIREKGKEQIIEKLEHLDEDKQIFIEAKKVGLFTWDDIPVRFTEPEEDAITFRGNDEDIDDYDDDHFVRRENEDQ